MSRMTTAVSPGAIESVAKESRKEMGAAAIATMIKAQASAVLDLVRAMVAALMTGGCG
jgi:hypothetical protein